MGTLFSKLVHYRTLVLALVFQQLQRLIRGAIASRLISPATQPDALQVSRRHLYHTRIFKPHHQDGGLRPLIVLVHGGAYIMNMPSSEDSLARYLANETGCIVASIDYRKAPIHPFPAANDDVLTTVLEYVNGTPDMPNFDRNKIILFGSSAGGTLVLGAAQDHRLRGKILGIVALYPAVDFRPTITELLASRPDPMRGDMLGSLWDRIMEIKLRGRDRDRCVQDFRLSPTLYRARSDLPRRIFMLGIEHDILCHGARVMAENLIGGPGAPRTITSDGWRTDDVQWAMVKGQTHAFDRSWKRDKEEEAQRKHDTEAMYAQAAQWVKDVLTNEKI